MATIMKDLRLKTKNRAEEENYNYYLLFSSQDDDDDDDDITGCFGGILSMISKRINMYVERIPESFKIYELIKNHNQGYHSHLV